MSAEGAGSTYLAFDTSTPVGSVVIGRATTFLAQRLLERRAEHAAALVPAIDEVLRVSGVTRETLAGLVVGEGPGSFTGVRVAAATAKGLAHALSLPLWAISSLAGAALAVATDPVRYALFDARQDRVYGACYAVEGGRVETLVEPHGGSLADVLAGDAPDGTVFVGDGAERHRAAIEAAGYRVSVPDEPPSLAEGLLRFLAARPEQPPVADAGVWEPRYIRPWSPDAAWVG